VGIIAKKGLEPSNCLKLSNAGDATQRAADLVQELLREPPAWLAEQMEKCQRDPGRFLNPTASAIAAELFGSPAQWREVRLVLEPHVSCSEAGDED